MNKSTTKLILSTLTSLCMLTALASAEDQIPDSIETATQDHISVRSRNGDPQKRERMQHKRAQERQDETGEQEPAIEQIQRAHAKLIESENRFAFAPRKMELLPFSLASTYSYPINCHWVSSISDTGRSVELEDGSHWDISPSDRSILYTWSRSDHIVVTPNYSWFSSFDYNLTNKSNNTNVKANLWIGPLAYGPYSHWIVDIDYFSGHLFLENQMVWCVDPKDSYILREWAVNDHVIFGVNNSWFSHYDHILINVNMDDHVRAKQY